jgi:hypothetical protein
MSSHEGGARGTYRTLETSHRDGTRDAPTEGDLYGNGVPIVIVRVTSQKARMGEPSTGERGTGGQTISSHAVREMRRARVALSVTCRLEATGVTTGERSDTETVTLRSERGDWKRAIARWYLASRLLNLGYPFQKRALMMDLPFLFLCNFCVR